MLKPLSFFGRRSKQSHEHGKQEASCKKKNATDIALFLNDRDELQFDDFHGVEMQDLGTEERNGGSQISRIGRSSELHPRVPIEAAALESGTRCKALNRDVIDKDRVVEHGEDESPRWRDRRYVTSEYGTMTPSSSLTSLLSDCPSTRSATLQVFDPLGASGNKELRPSPPVSGHVGIYTRARDSTAEDDRNRSSLGKSPSRGRSLVPEGWHEGRSASRSDADKGMRHSTAEDRNKRTLSKSPNRARTLPPETRPQRQRAYRSNTESDGETSTNQPIGGLDNDLKESGSSYNRTATHLRRASHCRDDAEAQSGTKQPGNNHATTLPVSCTADSWNPASSSAWSGTHQEGNSAVQEGAARKLEGGFVKESPVDHDLFPEGALHTPLSALHFSKEALLTQLNIEMVIPVKDGLIPDFRGLAELVGFCTSDILQFSQASNPAEMMFQRWISSKTTRPAVLRTLVECLLLLERPDILTDNRSDIWEDITAFTTLQSTLKTYTLGREDSCDCYVNLADQDVLVIGREIANTLGGVYKLKLCFRAEDVTSHPRTHELSSSTFLNRCNRRVLVVLTKTYKDSEAYRFFVNCIPSRGFAGRDAVKVIFLLVDKHAFDPMAMWMFAQGSQVTIDYNFAKELGDLWPRLNKEMRT